MTFETEDGRTMHGRSAQSTLVPGALLERGVHFLVGPKDDVLRAVA
jgi:hypothetical protein